MIVLVSPWSRRILFSTILPSCHNSTNRADIGKFFPLVGNGIVTLSPVRHIKRNGFIDIDKHTILQCRWSNGLTNNRCQTAAFPKSLPSNACDAVWNLYGCQTATTPESTMSNACDAIAYYVSFYLIPKYIVYIVYIGQIGVSFANNCIRIYFHKVQTATTRESTTSNACDAIGNNHRGQTATTIESTTSNACDTIWNNHRGQTAATRECTMPNTCNAIRNHHRNQTATTRECTMPNICNAIGNNHRGQTCATRECTMPNTCNAIRNHHRNQTATTFESLFSKTCYTRRDGDGGQTTAP